MTRWLALGLCAALLACGDDDASPPPSDDRFATQLASPDDYARLAGEGEELKYLVVADPAAVQAPLAGPCIFQDTGRFAFHVQFLRQYPAYANLDFDTYLSLVLMRAARTYWGGTLKPWASTPHPSTGNTGVISFSLYTEDIASEVPHIDEVAAVHTQLRQCMPYAADLLVFVPDGVAQIQWVRAERTAIMAAGIPVLLPEELRPDLAAEVYSEGETYGTLRIVASGEPIADYSPRDVLVADSAPNDIGVISGLITRLPQSLHSHVNLRLREKQTPNARVANIYDNALVQALDGHLVHVIAREGDVSIAAATLADAQAYWDAHRPSLPPLQADLSVSALAPMGVLSHDDALAYGTKATNLGELHRVLDEPHRVEGFGIPFGAYASFLQDSGLNAEVDALLADPLVLQDRAHLEQRLKSLRDAFKQASISVAFADALHDAVIATFGEGGLTTRLRFRSSTNAEDLEVLSGAGLYDSKSGCVADDEDNDDLGPSLCLSEADAAIYTAQLTAARAELQQHPERTWVADRITDLEQELSEEKSAAGAIKKVWASLWTLRAFEERDYYGIDQRTVYMGIAVNPSFVGEQLDCVAVTNLPADAAPVYRLVSQLADVGVVRPDDPTAIAETLTFERGAEPVAQAPQLLLESSLSPRPGQSLWTPAQLDQIAALLFAVQDYFATQVYPDVQPLSLDLEIKLTRDDRIVIKQARPYRLGAQP